MPLFPSARACLEATVARYAALSSYSDVGVVEDISKLRRPSCWFNTKFESPGHYRFEFVTAHPFWPLHHVRTKTILGSDGERNYYFRKFHGQSQRLSLPIACCQLLAGRQVFRRVPPQQSGSCCFRIFGVSRWQL